MRFSSNGKVMRETLDMVERFMRQERRIIRAIFLYAVMVGLFSLIIPLTVQELVNTCAFSIQPIMVVTLVSIKAGILIFCRRIPCLAVLRDGSSGTTNLCPGQSCIGPQIILVQ